MEQLTVKDAIEQGYEHFVYNSDGYQSLKELTSNDIDWSRDDIYVVGKEPLHPKGLTANELADFIGDRLEADYYEITGSDSNSVYDAIIEVDFSDIEMRINKALEKVNYYEATKIKLIP